MCLFSDARLQCYWEIYELPCIEVKSTLHYINMSNPTGWMKPFALIFLSTYGAYALYKAVVPTEEEMEKVYVNHQMIVIVQTDICCVDKGQVKVMFVTT